MPVELCVTLWAPALGRLYRREKKEVRMQSKIDLKPLLERTSTCGIKPCRVLVNCGCNNEEKTEGSMNGDDSLERHHFGGISLGEQCKGRKCSPATSTPPAISPYLLPGPLGG